jgi:hypothetical protein
VSDSVYQQTQKQNEFYMQLRAKGVYINQPDEFFYAGGNKASIGYDEWQYSLPRWEDLSVSRAGLYADLYYYMPSQGWMFLPIVEYHGGAADAIFRLHDAEYDWALAQYLGSGVAACYRGDVPFWNAASKQSCNKWIGFYKAHRATLIQPVVHLRRPDLQSWDGWLHVNPRKWTTPGQVGSPAAQSEVGVAVLFNPTPAVIDTVIALDLYYTGLNNTALVVVDEIGSGTLMRLDRGYKIFVKLNMPPKSVHTVVIRDPEG